jgi:hypothetical protein
MRSFSALEHIGDVTFVWIPKCPKYHPNSGLTRPMGGRKFNLECTGIEQVLVALVRKKARRKAGLFALSASLAARSPSSKHGNWRSDSSE